MSKKKEELVEIKSGALSIINFTQDAEEFRDAVGVEDMALPFLNILEALSPQVNKRKDEYIEGAEPGFIFNTVTNKLYERIKVVPCKREKAYVEWVPRDQGGGFVAKHDVASAIIKEAEKRSDGKLYLPNGNQLVETYYFYVLVVDDETNKTEWAIISMTVTRLKSARVWNTIINSQKMFKDGIPFNPPIFSHYYELTTVAKSGDSGDYHIWGIKDLGEISDIAHYEEAKAYARAVNQGLVNVSPVQEERPMEVPF